MPPAALLAAAGLGAWFLLSKLGPRKLTKADGPKLRQLQLLKMYISRDIRECAAKVKREQRRFTWADSAGVIAAMVSVAAGGDFTSTMTAARGARAVGNAVGWGHKDMQALCPGVRERVAEQVKRHDELSRELGLDPNMDIPTLQQATLAAGVTNINAV